MLIIHGSGVYNGRYEVLRRTFREVGFASAVWDKAGDGCSTGGYSSGNPIHERSREALALAIMRAGGAVEEYAAAVAPLKKYPAFPVLALFGDRDVLVDWRESKQVFTEAFKVNGSRASILKVFKDTDHNIKRGSDSQPIHAYIEAMQMWLKQR